MTVKEIESLTGIARANIRYYEQEGLLVPARLPNGYRDYSEQELEALEKIKLLRGLGVSIEDIRALQSGSDELASVLARRMRELEEERREAERAAEVCRQMRDSGVSYAALDARAYLNRLPEPAKETNQTIPELKEAVKPERACPWRRWLARMLDIQLYSTLLHVLLAAVFDVNILKMNSAADLVLNFFVYLLMLPIEAVLLRLFGTTFGKWVLGLRVETADGRKLSCSEGFNRTLTVLWNGMGFHIPIFNLVRLYKSYKTCSEGERLPWEYDIELRAKELQWYHVAGWIASFLLLFGALALSGTEVQLPPNRGELTVEEFAENYNYLAELTDSGSRLTRQEDGSLKFEDAWQRMGVVVHAVEPLDEEWQIEFVLEDGVIRQLCLWVEDTEQRSWLDASQQAAQLTALAFAGAQKEAGWSMSKRQYMLQWMQERCVKDYTKEFFGVEITNDVEYSGYRAYDSYVYLMPIEGAEQSFRAEIRMSK